jgi:hypothetical protein
MIVCVRHDQEEDFPFVWLPWNVALNHNVFMEVPAKFKIRLVEWRIYRSRCGGLLPLHTDVSFLHVTDTGERLRSRARFTAAQCNAVSGFHIA